MLNHLRHFAICVHVHSRAPVGHALTHALHKMQALLSVVTVSSTAIAAVGQARMHNSQAVQLRSPVSWSESNTTMPRERSGISQTADGYEERVLGAHAAVGEVVDHQRAVAEPNGVDPAVGRAEDRHAAGNQSRRDLISVATMPTALPLIP